MITLATGARVAATLFLAALMASCAKPADEPAPPSAIRIDGSSTLYPLTQAMAQSFQLQNPSAQVEIAESGTASGLQKFCAGEIDIADASRPIHAREMAACFMAGVQFIEAPVAFDALTVIAHPGVRPASVTLADLRTAWGADAENAVTNWRQINSAFPSAPLRLFAPGRQSGTLEYFNLAVLGDGAQSRTDYSASEDDQVIVDGVAATPGAMGYVGLSYYLTNQSRLKALAVDDGQGPIEPTPENVIAGRYHPLSRPVLLYVNAAALSRPEVQQFVEHYVANAPRLAGAQGFVPLPPAAYAEYLERVRNRTAGTAFAGGRTTGETIEQVIARPLVVEAPTP